MCDLLWSDPMEPGPDGSYADEYYMDNQAGALLALWFFFPVSDPVCVVVQKGRGCGQLFGPQAVEDFVADNSLVCIVRAHEVMREGFREYRFKQPVSKLLFCVCFSLTKKDN